MTRNKNKNNANVEEEEGNEKELTVILPFCRDLHHWGMLGDVNAIAATEDASGLFMN